MTLAPAGWPAPPGASPREERRNALLALTLSACLHLLLLMLFDFVPGSLRPGVMPSLRVALVGVEVPAAEVPAPDSVPRDSAPAPDAGAGDSAGSATPLRTPSSPLDGLRAERDQAGSSLPIPEGYFRRDQVDIVAVPTEQGPLVFPEDAYVWRLAGTVRARIYINERGLVDYVRIVESKPPGVFDKAALEALQRVRYEPAFIAGRPVKSQKLIEVKFDPYEKMPEQAPR